MSAYDQLMKNYSVESSLTKINKEMPEVNLSKKIYGLTTGGQQT